MSKLSDDELDELFRDKLLDLENDPLQKGWPLLAKDLKRQNFLTFGWKHFNIYQIAVGSLIFIAGLIYFIRSEKTDLPAGKNNSSLPEISSPALDSIPAEKTVEIKAPRDKKEITQTISKKDQKKAVKNVSGINTLPTQKTKQDSIASLPSDLPDNSPPEIKKKDTPKPKKIITIVKRDTLVVKDTIKVKKRKKSK